MWTFVSASAVGQIVILNIEIIPDIDDQCNLKAKKQQPKDQLTSTNIKAQK